MTEEIEELCTLKQLCVDTIHELNSKGLLVWPTICLNDEGIQLIRIDTDEELWKPVLERAGAK